MTSPPRTTAGPDAGTRGRILDIALRRFQHQGYAGTSIRDIAEELGVSKAAIYYHFRAKGELLDGLLGPVVSEVAHLLDSHHDFASAAGRQEFLERFTEVLAQYGPRVGTVITDPAIREYVEQHMHRSEMPDRIISELTAGLIAEGREADPASAHLRAACALACPPAGLQAWVAANPHAGTMDQRSRDLLVDCMLRVLGDR